MKIIDTLIRMSSGLSEQATATILEQVLGPVYDRFSSCPLTSAGLVIKIGGSTLAKTGASVTYLVVDGALVSIAASTDMPALTGISISANRFNVVCFFVDKSGTTSAVAGAEGAAIANVVWPVFPSKKALIGALLITNGASVFTGGTTPLDTATTVYLSPTGPFDPSARLGF